MLYPTYDALRRRRLIVAGFAALLLLIAAVTYAILVHRSHPSAAVDPSHADASEPNAAVKTEPVTELAVLQATSNPETFARQTAEALFEWDTATIVSRTDHIEQLVAVADPTGESTPGLVSDIDNYLPTQDAWAELTKYETRQWLVVGAGTTPTKWVEAVTQAGDQLLPGTTALTIHGTRHRSGVWEGEPAASEHDVAFTIFMVCGPSSPECHLPRLSRPDKPLE